MTTKPGSNCIDPGNYRDRRHGPRLQRQEALSSRSWVAAPQGAVLDAGGRICVIPGGCRCTRPVRAGLAGSLQSVLLSKRVAKFLTALEAITATRRQKYQQGPTLLAMQRPRSAATTVYTIAARVSWRILRGARKPGVARRTEAAREPREEHVKCRLHLGCPFPDNPTHGGSSPRWPPCGMPPTLLASAAAGPCSPEPADPKAGVAERYRMKKSDQPMGTFHGIPTG